VVVESLREEGLTDEEIHRLFEAEIYYPDAVSGGVEIP
jgi:hypothetical protein